MTAPDPATPEESLDRQHKAREALKLPGRYLLEDGSEHVCETVEIWPGGLSLKGPKPGPWGSGVLAYIEGLGRIHGVIIRRSPDGFTLAIQANARKEGRLSERMGSLLDGDIRPGGERRRSSRMRVETQLVPLRIAGRDWTGQLLDVSVEGAALVLDVEIPVGEDVWFAGRRAMVVRKFPGGGVAVRFI